MTRMVADVEDPVDVVGRAAVGEVAPERAQRQRGGHGDGPSSARRSMARNPGA